MVRGTRLNSPCMSDTTLLVSVEDLINMAMGPPDVNVVNFKMIQTVLHILARQLRMLETQVEIRITATPPPKEKKEKKKPELPSTESSSSKSPRKVSPPPKAQLKEIKEEKARPSRDREKEDKVAAKDKEKAETVALKEKEREGKLSVKEREKALKDQEKAEKAAAKDRDKAGRAESKERDKADRAASKEKDKAERAESKERDKAERAESKEREKAEKAAMKDKDKAGRAESKERDKAERAESKERAKAERSALKDKDKAERAESREWEKGEKAKEKAERAESKERDKSERAESKEREKAEKSTLKDKEKAEKEREKLEKMDAKDREKAEREREKLDKMTAKEREKAEREREKLDKMDAKDREKAERELEKLEKISAKEREKAEREREKLDKMDAKDREKAERELEKLEKMSAKEREKAEKEREKLDKMDAKDREKAERELEKLEKMSAKEREKAEREREKLEKMDAKDRERAEREQEKAERAAAKEKEKLEKMSAKEREKYLKEQAKEEKERAKSAAKDKIGISVKERQKDKVLIVEKGPTTRTDSKTRLGSIEVVTLSQFELLEAAVKDLTAMAGPLPFPAMPDNQKLRSELAKGSASLTDTMQAMQVAARVQAAETAVDRMAGLLTQLAAAGALPSDVAGKLEEVKAEMDAIAEESAKTRPTVAGRKSVAIDPMSKKASKVEGRSSSVPPRPSVTSRASLASRASIGAPCVTHIEMDDAIRSLKDDLMKSVNNSTARATAAAESAAATAKAVSDKLDIALKLNNRINTLFSLVTDYAEQLSGFDSGLTTQMQSFQEQMAQMRSDLKGGLTQLETANNNAETAAVLELTERYEGLVTELDRTLHAHQALTAFQNQLADEMRSLLDCVEMLREQKADRDEVQDGLRDKADNSRLAGLLTEADFALSRAELERRLECCYDKFRKQEQVWIGAIKDLSQVAEGKAEIMQLLAAKDDAQQQLRDIQNRLQKLAVILGEPKAAMITRQLSRGAHCGACQVPALQEPTDISYGKPYPLPAFRHPPAGEEKPCVPEWRPPQPPDDRDHTCHRWVGGSHTLLAESVVREQAPPLQTFGPPSKKYAGYGSDGRLYMMEEQLQPCVECNQISTDDHIAEESKQPEVIDPRQTDGAGDTGTNQAALEKTL